MKRLARTVALTAASTMVGGGLLVTAAPANAYSVFVIRVNEYETSSTDPQHNPPRKDDTFSFESDLKQRGDKVGTDAGECVFVKMLGPVGHPTGAKVRCDVVFTFSKGTIHARGTTRFHFNETRASFHVPIVGGTDKFEGVRGNVVVHEVSDSKSRLAIRLRNFA